MLPSASASSSSSSSSSSLSYQPPPPSHKRSRDDVLDALQTHNGSIALQQDGDDASFEAFSDKLADPNSTWTPFEKSLFNVAGSLDVLSPMVVAKLYKRLKTDAAL